MDDGRRRFRIADGLILIAGPGTCLELMDDGRRRFRIADVLILIAGLLGTCLELLRTVAAAVTLEAVWPAFLVDEDGEERSVKPLGTGCPLGSRQGCGRAILVY
jgi:hypothetical protein